MAVGGRVEQAFRAWPLCPSLVKASRLPSAVASLLVGLVLLALSAVASPAMALTCPDETGHSVVNKVDVTYFLTATTCSKTAPASGLLLSARVKEETAEASVTFGPEANALTNVSTSFTTGIGCTGVLTPTSANVAGFRVGTSRSCTTTIRLEGGGEMVFVAAHDGSSFVASLTSVRLSVPATTTAVASAPNPSTFGQSVTFTATVTGGVGAPAGNVDFKDGGVALGSGELGDVGGGLAAVSIAGSVEGNHGCSITTIATVKCWGLNFAGQLGNGTTGDSNVPVDVQGLASVVAIGVGTSHSCALTSGGGVKCWGSNLSGQLGHGGLDSATPVNVTGLISGATAIAVGNAHSCALTTSGGVKCWGFNSFGQLGDGSIVDRITPVDVSGLTSGVGAIAAGGNRTCAIMAATGAAKCWGSNGSGGIGDNSTINRFTPTDVSGLTSGVAMMSVGVSHTCGVTTAGAALCWGGNLNGQLGNGSTTNSLVPVAVSTLDSNVAFVSAGRNHTCALMITGAVTCWGSNQFSQLGNGTGTSSSTPVNVASLGTEARSIVAANALGFAVTNGLGAMSWGTNFVGGLGAGAITFRSLPGDVSGLAAGKATATLSTSALGVGNHAITTVYAGDQGRTGSSSIALAQTVSQASTTTVMTAVPASPGTFGQSVTLTATVSSAGGTPGGTVTFTDNVNGALGNAALNAGVATLSTSALSAGSHTITATYAATTNFLGSAGSVARTVNQAPNVITFPALANRALGTTAPVPAATASSGLAITYASTTASVCTATGAGVITLVSVGTCSITASQAGNANFVAAASVSRSFSVTPAASTSTVSTSGSPSVFGASVTFTATVSASAGGTPAGSVTFRDGATSLGVRTLAGGTATFTTTSLGAGARSITVVYGGSATHAGSTSAALTQTVTKRASTTSLTASKNPAPLGAAVTLTANVGTGATGNVTFRDGATTLATVALANGAASTAFTPSVAGSLSLTAAYAGDANVNASTSTTLKLLAFASCKDAFASALPVSGANASVFGSTIGATGETGEPNHAGNSGALNSVWCTWTAPAAGQVTIDTTGSSFDTTLGVYTGAAVAGLTQVAANDNIGAGNTRSRVSFVATAGTAYRIAIDGVSATGAYVLNIALAPPAPVTFASVLPTARSIGTGATATAFATMINTGTVPATACSLALPPGYPANFSYQITNASNAPTGTPDTPQTIAAGAAQGFFFAVTPLVDLNSSELAIVFDCTNTPTTITVPGLNTLLLSASSTPSPDLVSIGSTPSGDGIANIPGATGSTAFGAATVNIGAAGTITASVDDNGRGLPLVARLCVTNPTTGACTNPATPAATATFALAANASATVAVFVTGTGNVPFDPGANRLFLRFKTADGVTRGATSVAVRTQ